MSKPIAAIQGANGAEIQGLLRDFITRWDTQVKLVGVVEPASLPGQKSARRTRLRNIVDGSSHSVFQELGSGSLGCSLDSRGVTLAGHAVAQQIALGCDLVILSKFGKTEAEDRSGLLSAFIAAVEAGIPILTSVSPNFQSAWSAFASPLFEILPADSHSIERWWGSLVSIEE